MQYMGGKSRIAKHIRDAILADTTNREVYIEPFVGGGNCFEIVAPYFRKSIGSDNQIDVIMLHNALKRGWVPPTAMTRSEWEQLRYDEPSALRAFAGYGCSYAGKFFEGYASESPRSKRPNTYAQVAHNALSRQGSVLRSIDASFVCSDYAAIKPPTGSVVYCDPPYSGTTGYTTKFDASVFWRTVNVWADSGADVYVSEYTGKGTLIWEGEIANSLSRHTKNKRVVEKLYRV